MVFLQYCNLFYTQNGIILVPFLLICKYFSLQKGHGSSKKKLNKFNKTVLVTHLLLYLNKQLQLDCPYAVISYDQHCLLGEKLDASPSDWKCSITTLWRILNGFHAAGYRPNSAESEPIWMKFGKLSDKCWGLAMAGFGRDPRSSHSLRGSRKMFVFCQVNNARFHRFPVGQFSRILHTTTSIGVAT